MKILFLSDGLFPFQLGGMQKHSSTMVKLLAERGVNVIVVHPGGKDYSPEKIVEYFGNQQNLEFVYIPFPIPPKFPGHYIRANKIYSKHALDATSNMQFDLVYAQGFTGYAFIKSGGLRKNGPPVVVNLHGYGEFFAAPDFKTALQYRMLRPIMTYLSTSADYVYSFGGKITEKLVAIGVNPAKILEHANGIEESFLTQTLQNSGVRKFIFIGRNESRKGLTELFEAIEQARLHVDFEFHFVGFHDARFSQMTGIYFHGEIRDAQKIKDLLDTCDCLVLPSYAEGMPTVILEAMARGLAIIATDVGAVSKMICGNGILLKSPEVTGVKNALLQICSSSEDQLKSMKEKSFNLVKEHFLWSKIADQKLEDFQRILSVNS